MRALKSSIKGSFSDKQQLFLIGAKKNTIYKLLSERKIMQEEDVCGQCGEPWYECECGWNVLNVVIAHKEFDFK